MTCKSPMAAAVRDLCASPGRSMAVIQASIIQYFETHHITKFVMYAMTTDVVGTGLSSSGGVHNRAAIGARSPCTTPGT